MADLLAGPNAPLSRAFLFCGWHCIPVDWLLDPSHDLSCPERQQSLAEQLSTVDFICAAMDCSTKSRAREIPRSFDDGRPAPRPLRSVEFPEGLPQLSPSEQARVDTDNTLYPQSDSNVGRTRGRFNQGESLEESSLASSSRASYDGFRPLEGQKVRLLLPHGGPLQEPVPEAQS